MTCHICGCEMQEVPHFDPPRWLHLWECDCELARVLVPFANLDHVMLNVTIDDDPGAAREGDG